jgi:hypothetical protein
LYERGNEKIVKRVCKTFGEEINLKTQILNIRLEERLIIKLALGKYKRSLYNMVFN